MDVDVPEHAVAKPSPITPIFRPPSPHPSLSYDNLKRASLSSQVSSRRSSNTSRRRRIENQRKSDASSYGDRRGSLPVVNFRPVDHPVGSLPQSSVLPNYDPSIYQHLSTFTFGDAGADDPSQPNALPATNGTTGKEVSSSADEAEESMEEMDEEERMQAERTKLRAMDDGTRRPSLPINMPPGNERRRSTIHRLAGGVESMQMDDVLEVNETTSLPARLEPKALPRLPLAPFKDLPQPMPFHQLPPRKDLQAKLEASAAAEGFDLNYIIDATPANTGSPKLDSDASGASPPPANGAEGRESSPSGGYMDSAGYQAILDHEWGTAFHIPGNISPRSSLMEDPFMKMVEELDPVYNKNRNIWTFKKVPPLPKLPHQKKSDAFLVTNGASEDSPMSDPEIEKEEEKATQKGKEREHMEVVMWSCPNVGQYGLWPGRSTPNGDHRRPSVLYAISGEGGKRRGPTYLIHKHSRCHAFSIFQGYQVTGQKILAAHAMLLSNKAIQYSFANSPEHKNNAKPRPHEPYEDDPDVQKLQTHHLVEEDAETPPANQTTHQHDHIVHPQPQQHRGHTPLSNAGSPKQTPLRQASATPERTLSRKGSNDLLRQTPRAGPSSFHVAAELPKPELEGFVAPEGSAASTSTLTPHPKPIPLAVAFDVVDPSQASQNVLHRASTTRFEWFKRAFTGKANGTAPRVYVGNIQPPPVESPYSPPWLLMAPQSVKQEEERMLQNLNDSFRAVGLIPNPKLRQPPPLPGPRPRKSKPRSPIIDGIPRDAMMMLMPLWIAEGGNAGGVSKHFVPMDERTYLLVYYVPFDGSAKAGSAGASASGKKRTRSGRDRSDRKKSMAVTASERALLSPTEEEHTTSAEAPPPPKRKKTSFRVVARMLSYADVKECGIKLPRFGLAVHGSLSDALLGNPAYHALGEDFSAVVAICHGEDAGVELITEGLDKLGLRKSKNALADEQQIALAAMRMDAVAMKDEYESRQSPLTPIGKSVVEMIFAGCVSILDVGFR